MDALKKRIASEAAPKGKQPHKARQARRRCSCRSGGRSQRRKLPSPSGQQSVRPDSVEPTVCVRSAPLLPRTRVIGIYHSHCDGFARGKLITSIGERAFQKKPAGVNRSAPHLSSAECWSRKHADGAPIFWERREYYRTENGLFLVTKGAPVQWLRSCFIAQMSI
jgi:hypothetical protein